MVGLIRSNTACCCGTDGFNQCDSVQRPRSVLVGVSVGLACIIQETPGLPSKAVA